MDVVLRHRSASGGCLENLWDLDEGDDLLASIVVASARPVHVVVPLASFRRPVKGRFGVVRLSSESWRVAHGLYDAHHPQPRLPDISLILTLAPGDFAVRLDRIAR